MADTLAAIRPASPAQPTPYEVLTEQNRLLQQQLAMSREEAFRKAKLRQFSVLRVLVLLIAVPIVCTFGFVFAGPLGVLGALAILALVAMVASASR